MGVLPRLFLPLGFAAAALAQPSIRLIPIVTTGLSEITAIASARDGSGRLFIAEQAGRIKIVRNGRVEPRLFLDITSLTRGGGERGLLGVAFPPGFAEKQRFYVYYTDPTGDLTIARFRVSADPNAADPASGQVVLTVPHRQFANHNGGDLHFGSDGYLYIGTGDGGSGGDPFGSGQNTNSLLGKLLRIDVESGAATYSIPPSNPFAGRAGFREEIWAYGLRNPWRFSFDRETNDLYIGDVGQNTYEEISFQPAGSAGGVNFGWNQREGAHCFVSNCRTDSTDPIAEYRQSSTDGCSVTGGYVYRGPRYAALRGYYIYGDYCTGRIWTLRQENGTWVNRVALNGGGSISAFGEDDDGNLYMGVHVSGVLSLVATGAPVVTREGVVNAAGFGAGTAAGSIATVFGAGIAGPAGIVSAGAFPLATTLGGARVLLNDSPAPLFAVAQVGAREQINFQIPFGLIGRATLVVESQGQRSAPVEIEVASAAPGIFLIGDGRAAALDAANAVVSAANAAAEGSIVNVFATGLGAVTESIAAGQPAPLDRLVRTAVTPQASVGERGADVLFSGLAPGFAGLYQVQIRIPAGIGSGPKDLTLSIGGAVSNVARIDVR